MSEPTAIHIETFGCQMNKLDSELVMAALTARGFAPAASAEGASVILFNTCSVRDHAEQRVYSRLAALKRRAEREGDLVVGVIGCMAQKDAAAVFERCPWVSLVCGPTKLDRLPDLIRQALAGYRRLQAVSADIRVPARAWDPPRPGPSPAQRYVRIMHGCNNFCAYCIVPYVRGPEISRPPEEIVEEVRRLAAAGCREVTLLGQNVNSYRYGVAQAPSPAVDPSPFQGEGGVRVERVGQERYGPSPQPSPPGGEGAAAPHGVAQAPSPAAFCLPQLLERLDAIDGLLRIRFVTSHPKDLTDDTLDAMAGLEKVCEHLHLPAQAGSDSELIRMNRGYTRAQYLRLIEQARHRMPGIGLMSDFIVGFPGQTQAEFEATRTLIEEVHYKNCFIFRYSPRPGTAGARMTDDVPPEIKQGRLEELLAVQRRIAEADNRRFIGRDLEILVEGPSRKAAARLTPQARPPGGRGGVTIQLVGRTRSDHIVVFDGSLNLVGTLATVHISDATDLTLFGTVGG